MVIPGEEPAVVVFLEQVGTDLRGIGIGEVKGTVDQTDTLFGPHRLEQAVDPFQSLELPGLVHLQGFLEGAGLSQNAVFQMGDHPIHSLQVTESSELLENEQGISQIGPVLSGQGLFGDGEIRIVVMISQFSGMDDRRFITELATLHGIHVTEYGPAGRIFGVAALIFPQGIPAGLSKLFPTLVMATLPEAGIQDAVADHGVEIGRHLVCFKTG